MVGQRYQPYILLSLWTLAVLLSSILGGPGAQAAVERTGLGVHAGSHVGFGRVGTESESINTRTVGALDFQLMPAFRYRSLMAGLLFEYRLLGQIDEATSVGNTDLSGDSFHYGPGISYELSGYKLLFNYVLGSNYSVSNYDETTTAERSYTSGGGFQFLFGIEIAPEWYFDFSFSQLKYGKQDLDGVETQFSDANEVKHWNFGFGVSYSY